MRRPNSISVGAITFSTLCAIALGTAAAKPSYEVKDGIVVLSNAHLEIGFQESDGGVAYITDRKSGERLNGLSGVGRLWWATLGDTRLNSIAYKGAFSYGWNPETDELTLSYKGTPAKRPDVTIRVGISDNPAIRLTAQVDNSSSSTMSAFAIPGDIRVPVADVTDALLPMLPGVRLQKAFFTSLTKYDSIYPGGMFADYLALNSTKGSLAVYGGQSEVLQPVSLGFEPVGGRNGYTRLTHVYHTWVGKGQRWQSPPVYMSVGQGYPESIAAYRTDKGIADYKTLARKLGSKKEQFFASALYKLDMGQVGRSFVESKADVIDKLPIPGIIHLVAFQPRGFDKCYPDFLPPNPSMGSQADLTSLVSYAKKRGNLVIPYTNFSWWDTRGPTMSSLPQGMSPADIAANAADGTPLIENYGDNYGYVMNQHSAFVKSKVASQFRSLRDSVGVDGVFEDQWGARIAPLDFNAQGLKDGLDPSTSYYMGVLAHAKAFSKDMLMTECGVDVLANDEVGFNGTNYLWDMKGYKAQTAPYSLYYPMAGLLMRDKVFLYQHDLAPETWTADKAMLRWNLAMGYNLSSEVGNPWLNVVGVFQKYVLARYADRLVKDYRELGDEVYLTTFDGYSVYTNWDESRPFNLGNLTTPGGGVIVKSDDGSVTGGVFTFYNGQQLAPGEHYLAVIRSAQSIRIFQPAGSETSLRITKPSEWKQVSVKAYSYDGTLIRTAKASVAGDIVDFYYYGTASGKRVGYYELTGR